MLQQATPQNQMQHFIGQHIIHQKGEIYDNFIF